MACRAAAPARAFVHMRGTVTGKTQGSGHKPGCVELAGDSPLVRRALELVQQAAIESGNVLILAEPGLDTTSVGREVHLLSSRGSAPFVALDCATIDAAEVENRLFGRRVARRARGFGDLETVAKDSAVLEAGHGTLFLAHIGELPASAQRRLARVVRDGEVRVTGSTGSYRVGARLMAGAAPDLETDVEEGRFRGDLYRRLRAFEIQVPPLRQRAEDVPVIATHAATEICVSAGQPIPEFTQVALTLLAALPWRGNISELRTLLERVILARSDEVIRLEDLLTEMRLDGALTPLVPNGSLREARRRFEREYVAAVLQHHRWRMADAARALGIQRTNLYRKARQLGLRRGRAFKRDSG